MEAIISYRDGRRVEVLVATVGRFTMRVIARESGDATDLRLDYGQWVDEAGMPVEFDAFLIDDAAAASPLCELEIKELRRPA